MDTITLNGCSVPCCTVQCSTFKHPYKQLPLKLLKHRHSVNKNRTYKLPKVTFITQLLFFLNVHLFKQTSWPTRPYMSLYICEYISVYIYIYILLLIYLYFIIFYIYKLHMNSFNNMRTPLCPAYCCYALCVLL